MSRKQHWDDVYDNKTTTKVSWYTPHLARSLELIERAALGPSAAVIDVGGGASTLPADLLERGLADITVLDISHTALRTARAALGPRAASIKWITGDVTSVELPRQAYDLWHDRAVFHFLTDAEQRQAYLEQVQRALRPGGKVVVATFGPQGPLKCSGLEVVRYDDATLVQQFGALFERVHCVQEHHTTPWGSEQEFVYCLCRRVS